MACLPLTTTGVGPACILAGCTTCRACKVPRKCKQDGRTAFRNSRKITISKTCSGAQQDKSCEVCKATPCSRSVKCQS
eukprot:1145625-Pelagomonas_calceolata.AAC.2